MSDDGEFYEDERDFHDSDEEGIDPLLVGAAYAIGSDIADRRSRSNLKESFTQAQEVIIQEPTPELINAAEFALEGPQNWDDFIGQDRIKQQLAVHINSAKQRRQPLDHVLLASGMPGVGKTTLAHLIAKEMGSYLMKLVPPFHKDTLFKAVQQLSHGDVLFIDEIHKMADNGPRMAENLLHILEESRLYTDDGAIELKKFTVIGATTDSGKLPEPVLDRFVIKPHFEPYTTWDLALMSAQFAGRYWANIGDDVVVAIAAACRSTPRVARELVLAGRDLALHYKRSPTPEELFEFKQMDPDGMTMQHRKYLIAMYRHFARKGSGGRGIEYIGGENTLLKLLRETKRGLASIERYLLEQGLIDQTPQGRRLTETGIVRARHYDALENR